MAVLDEVTSVGLESQRNAGRQLELVKTRLATFLDEKGASKEVAVELMDLRSALDRINPELEQRSLRGRTIGALPFLRNNVMVRSLKRIALRYEPVAKQITVIETKLRGGPHTPRPRQRGAPPTLRGRRGPTARDPPPGLPRHGAARRAVRTSWPRPTTRWSAIASRRPCTTWPLGSRTCTRWWRSTSSTS